jgi:hypothetical protein
MARLDLRGRLLLAIGAGTVAAAACGSGAIQASSGGAGGGLSVVDGGEAGRPFDEGGPGLDATQPDGDGQACGALGAPCTQLSDCCYPACVNGYCAPQPPPSVRRPFLVGSSLRRADAAPRVDWVHNGVPAPFSPDLDERTRDALARSFLYDACEEYASIAAFARFTMHLVSVGAPPDMIAESQRASLDEIKHARACFALAQRYGGGTMGPGSLSLEDAMPEVSLAEIAALTAEEGCVGETLGVLLAEQQLANATDPFVRAILVDARIVEDEARHAELAWRFVAWAIARGGEPVRRAVRAAIQRAAAETLAVPIHSYDGVDADVWRAHGRFTCADAHAVVVRGLRDIVEPCAAGLLGDPLLAHAESPSRERLSCDTA